MTPTPALVRALLERNQRELWRMGELPPPSEHDDLETINRRAVAAQLTREIKGFQHWLAALSATPTPRADPPPGGDRNRSD